MNYYVCLQIRICPNLKIFRRHERPVRPYERFSYVLPYSLKRNLFLMFRCQNLNWNFDLNRYCFLILSRLCRFRILNLIFLNLNWSQILILRESRLCLLREMLHLPYERFSYVQLYSLKQNLFLKFHCLKMTCLFLLILILILRNFFLFLSRNLNHVQILILHENHLYRLRK